MDEVRQFWNSVADRYDHQASKRVGLAHRRRFIDAVRYLHANPGDSILNVWSRTGGLVPYLRQHCGGLRILNLELSDKLIDIAKNKYPSEIFLQTRLDSFPCDTETFQWVISLETLEHCPRPQDFLCEVRRVLKPDGILILSCPPATAEPMAYLAYKFLNFHGEGPHRFPGSRKVKRLAQSVGLELLHHQGTVLLPFGPESVQRFVWKLENTIQWLAPVREMGIRQFFVFKKGRGAQS